MYSVINRMLEKIYTYTTCRILIRLYIVEQYNNKNLKILKHNIIIYYFFSIKNNMHIYLKTSIK